MSVKPSGAIGVRGRQRILVIEDDPTMRRVLKDNFEFSGFEVRVAADGRDGLRVALQAATDIILLDVMLPLLSGFDLCRRIRSAGLATPIILLTAKSQES